MRQQLPTTRRSPTVCLRGGRGGSGMILFQLAPVLLIRWASPNGGLDSFKWGRFDAVLKGLTMPGVAPAGVRHDLQRLATALDAQIPTKDESNLLIATWNPRAFGGLTSKWQSAAADTPKSDRHAVVCIAALVSQFDG